MEIFKLDQNFEFESRDQFIELKKKVNEFTSVAYSEAWVQSCYYCKVQNPQLCNSHYIPAFVLKNIGEKGKLYNFKRILANNIGDEEDGIHNSGTFKMICRDCDSKIFSDYENPNNYKGKITQRILAQIAMKCSLKDIYKKYNEISIYKRAHEMMPFNSFAPFNIDEINTLDLREAEQDFKRAKKVSQKAIGEEYYIILRRKLPYIVPLAAQDSIALSVDFEGNIINDLQNMNENYKIRKLYIAVFPMEKETEVLLFIDAKDSSRYRQFYKQLRKLKDTEQLCAINYLLFMYSEEIYLSKQIPETILNNSALRDAARTTSSAFVSEEDQDTTELIANGLSLSKMHDIPNLLLLQKVNNAYC